MRTDEELRRATLTAGHRLLVLILVGVLLWLLYQVRTVVIPIVLAVFVASVLIPPRRLLVRRGLGPAAATALVCVVGIAAATGAIWLLAPTTIDGFARLADSFAHVEDELQQTARSFGLDDRHLNDVTAQVRDWAGRQSGTIASGALSGVRTTGEILIGVVLALVLAIYLTHGGRTLLHWTTALAPAAARDRIVETVQLAFDVVGRYVRGIALVGFVDAFFIGVALWALGVPIAIPLAVLTWIGAFLPIVGAFTAGLLAAVVAFVAKGWVVALIVVAVTIAIQQIEGHILAPQIYGRALELPSAIVLVVIALGGTLGGIVGAFLAAPVASVAVAVVRRYQDDAAGKQPAAPG